MSTETLTSIPQTDSLSPDAPVLNLGLATPNPKKRRPGPQSKIAQLPKAQRDLINQLLDEEKTYEQVIEELAKQNVSLTTDNVYGWFHAGYQDYLSAREWQEQFQQVRESVAGLGEDPDELRFQQGVIQFSLTKIFCAIKDDRYKDDAPNSIRLFNSMARLSREALVIRKYADQRAAQTAEELEQLDPNRDLSKERELTVAAMERIFGFKAAKGPIGPDMNEYMAKHAHLNKGTANEKYATFAAQAQNPTSRRGEQAEPVLQHPKHNTSKPAIAADTEEPSETQSVPQFKIDSTAEPDCLSRSDSNPPDAVDIESPTEAPSSPLPIPKSKIQNQNSKIAESPLLLGRGEGQGEESLGSRKVEHCHSCRAELPPLLPNGERPHTHCQQCGTALRHPATLHFYCPHPACGGRMIAIFQDDQRTSDHCPHCNTNLPPWPSTQTQQAA